MNQTLVLLGFFTVLLALLFKIVSSILSPELAFVVAIATTTLLVLGMYGLSEGINHDTNFTALTMNGQVRLRPRDLTVAPNTSDLSVLIDLNNTKLDGRSYGSIF